MPIETVEKKPLVLACSGCSNAGCLAHSLARELDARGHAEMSCLAGVAAQNPTFLKKVDSRETWIIDGCPIECAAGIFKILERTPGYHIRLQDCGVKKNSDDANPSMDRLVEYVLNNARSELCTIEAPGC